MAVVAIEGNGSRPSHLGDGYGGEISFTLNSDGKLVTDVSDSSDNFIRGWVQ